MAILELDKKYPIDKRFDRLGELTKLGKYDAKGRVMDLWLVCIEETQDVRTAEEIDNLTGWFEAEPFVELMIKSRLAEATEGGYRIRGVRDRMGWLVDYREKQVLGKVPGGKARAASAERDDKGHFKPSITPAESSESPAEPATDPVLAPANPASPAATPAPAPAASSVSSTSSHSVHCSLIPDSCFPNAASGAPPAKKPSLDPALAESAKRLKGIWLKTLEHFKQPRPLVIGEDLKIVQGILRWGADPVELALIGIRYEKKSTEPNGFDPAQHVYLDRVLKPDKFLRFVSLGAAAAERQRVKLAQMKPAELAIVQAKGGIETSAPLSAEQIKAALGKWSANRPLPPIEEPPKEPETPEEIAAACEASLTGVDA